VQTTQTYGINSVFETTVDISGLDQNGVAMFTLYRNEMESLGAAANRLAVSLVFDRAISDEYVKTNKLTSKDIAVMTTIMGAGNSTKKQLKWMSSIYGVDKTALLIKVNFTSLAQARITVNG